MIIDMEHLNLYTPVEGKSRYPSALVYCDWCIHRSKYSTVGNKHNYPLTTRVVTPIQELV